MDRRKIINGILMLSGGQASSYALSFLRNIIFARMLTQADFGITSIFIFALNLMDFNSRMSFGQQVVQARDGNSQDFLNTAHAFNVIVGLMSAIILALLAYPISLMLGIPDTILAFALLALIPFFRGFQNLDLHRRQRELEYKPAILTEFVPQLIVTALAWPIIKWFGGIRAVLFLIILKCVLTMFMSHILSQLSYRWSWDKQIAWKMWLFSWPLVINGFLMFISHQGDRLLVGSGFSLEVLALYSAAAMFTSVPFMIFGSAFSSLVLPLFSRVQDNFQVFRMEYRSWLEISSVGAVILMAPIIIGGEQILVLLFGVKYSNGGILMAWLAAAYAFRFLRLTPATAAMAKADTKNNMYANLFRTSSLIGGVIVIFAKGSIELMAACMFSGEIVALAGSAWLLTRRLKIPFSETIKTAGYTGSCLAIAGLFVWFGSSKWGVSATIGASLLLITFCLIFARLLFPDSISRLWQGVCGILKQRGGSQAMRIPDKVPKVH